MIIGSLYFGLYPAVWCTGIYVLRGSHIPLIISAPALWVSLDYLKAHAGFLALPWATLAQSQHNNLPILQITTLTGEYGVTFLIVMGSVAIAEVITNKAYKIAVASFLLIAFAHIWGFHELSKPHEGSSLRVAAVQPSILLGERKTPDGQLNALERLEKLTLAASESRPALIAWPETSVQGVKDNRALIDRLKTIAQTAQTPLIIGSSEVTKFTRSVGGDNLTSKIDSYQYNSAYFIPPDEPIPAPYQKRLLVPFGEYLPSESFIKWPVWFISKAYKSLPGDQYKYFRLKNGSQISPIICWENLFDDFVRPIVKDGAQVLVQLTNDNWFQRTAAPYQHNLASVLRAVENRVPIVIASNTGPSQIIDKFGHVNASIPGLFVTGIASADVTLGNDGTFYTHFGNIFMFIAITISLVSITLGLFVRMRGVK